MENQKKFHTKALYKTESGLRIISLDDDTIKVLEEWEKVQKNHGVEQFILSYTDLPSLSFNSSENYSAYAKLAKVPIIQGKGLRHSHVSYLINEFNADILVVSQRLGHSSPEITLKHYAHLWSRHDEGIAEQMTGNIKFTYAKESSVANFNGNQAVKI